MAAVAAVKAFSVASPVRQVTKSNFASAIQQFKSDIEASEFVAISTRKTGDFSSSSSHGRSWRNVVPIDTPETAYLKSKSAAETFELSQFAVCPFSIHGSKVLAFPYNFLLFPRDEFALGLPSYSFSCQASFLASMAREGFDFNSWIYNGISYLSRAQEAMLRERNPSPWMHSLIVSSRNPSVADSIFKERIKSRILYWMNACRCTSQTKDESLSQSLRKILVGEAYGSRPGLSLDICSEKQVQMIFEIVEQISDSLVPIINPDIGEQPKAVRIVLTSSEEDKKILLTELQSLKDEQNLKIRGFRQVIDIISSSQKTVVSYNCLHDFTFIHQKFVAPLPTTLPEFMYSLKLLFPSVIDLNHLLKEFGPLRKAKNIPSAMSYIKRQFFVPIELKVPEQFEDENNNHGNNVLKLTSLFAKLNRLLEKASSSSETTHTNTKQIRDYANIFNPASLALHDFCEDNEASCWIDSSRRVSTDRILFLWGFGSIIPVAELKHHLLKIHPAFLEEFDVKLVDKSCAVVVFQKSESAATLLKDMSLVDSVHGVLREMVVEGLRAAGYDAYKKVCKLDHWEEELADSFEFALAETLEGFCSPSSTDTDEIQWNSELMIDLNEL